MNKVSIILPVYNGEKYLKRCIDSLLNQTYTNIEYIFVNDGSIDDTLNILNDYSLKDKRIIVINKENTGVSDSRNKGIEASTGKYLCFCDADDIYEENYVQMMHDLMVTHNVSAVKCNFRVISNSGKQIDVGNCYFENGTLDNKDIIDKLIPLCLEGKIPCFTYLLMINKENLKVKFPTDIAMMEDVVFYINLLLNIKNIYITNEQLYTIMYNDEGATNNVKNYKRNILNILLVNKYIRDILIQNNLLNDKNGEKLNINHLNSIADFIFRYYLYSKNAILFCKKIRTPDFVYLVDNTNLSKINLVRRVLLKLIRGKHYFLLRIYFLLRKFIFKFKRR